MAVALFHPRIPPIKREEIPCNKTDYSQRLYHTSSVVDFAMPYIKGPLQPLQKQAITNPVAFDATHSTEFSRWLRGGTLPKDDIQMKEAATKLLHKQIPESIAECLADGRAQVAMHRDLVEMHFDQRCSLFFSHLITCYNTPYEFSIAGASEQFGKGGLVKLTTETNRKISYKTQAAHSSTLPGLLFRVRGSQEAWSVYLKGSHTSNLHNATITFHICLNGADTLIDGLQEQKGKLRHAAIQIINDVAQAKLQPVAAMHRFIKDSLRIINAHIKELPETDPRRSALLVYAERASEIQVAIKEEGYFDALLTMKISGDCQESKIRAFAYANRFSLIKETQLIETHIACAILETNKHINRSAKTTSVAKINADLRFHLLHKSSGHLQKSLFRFFGTSPEQLDLGYDLRNHKAKEIEREQFYTKHKPKIEALFRDLRQLFYNICRAEALSWSKGIRGIREIRGWSQEVTAAWHRALYPGLPMSRSTYHRREMDARPNTQINYLTPEAQRRQSTSPQEAMRFAKVFRIDPGLLLAQMSGSIY